MNNRIEDTPELFGRGCGVSTCGDFKCDWCGIEYNKGADANEDYSGDSVGHTDFAGKQICECCFGSIESAVLQRMGDILPWYRRHVERVKKSVEKADSNLRAVGS